MSPLLGSIGGISEYNYRGSLDDWPNPFAFQSAVDVEPGSTVGISTVIGGINYKSSVSATTGSLISVRGIIGITSIYSGDSVTPSSTVTVSIAKSTTELSVGKNIRILNASDPTYNGEYTISSLIDSPYVTRFTYQVPTVPSDPRPGVSTAQFNYEVYPFIENQLVYIRNGQILEVKVPTTSGNNTDFDKQYRTTVRVGKRYADWNVRTREKDNTPVAFTFNNVVGVNIGIATTSNSVVISGLEPGFSSYAFISSGIGSFSLNGSVGVTTSNVVNGDVIFMNEVSSDYYSTLKSSSLTVGTYTTSFSVTTRDAGRIPNQFLFNSLINAPINQDQVSISTSLTGADNNIPLGALVSFPGELQVNSDQYITGTTEVLNGDSVRLKIPASTLKEYGTTYSTQLTVSGVSSSFFVTTRPRPIKTFPNQFTFTDLSGVSPSAFVESNVITLSGMTIGVGDTGLASISGGGSQFKVIRNGSILRDYSSLPFPVINADQIQLKVLSAGEGSSIDSKFLISGVDTTNVIAGINGVTADTWTVSSRVLNCRINETAFRSALTTVENAKIRQLRNTIFTVSGLDNGCDTVIVTSNPDSYIRNQNGTQVANNQPLDIKNGDIIAIYMTAAATYDTEKSTTVEVKRRGGSDLVSGTWKIKTQLEDKLPDPFNLPTRNESNVSPCTFRSTYVTEGLTGLSEETVVTATVTSTNGTAQISKNGGTFGTSILGGVKNGDRIDIRMKSNCDYGGSCETATVVVGERTDTWTLCPEQIPFPTVTLQANTTSIPFNGSVTLTWSSTFATSVTNSTGNGFTGIGVTQGTITINNLTSSSTFAITVANTRGTATSSVNINVGPQPANPPTITLSASPTTVSHNGSTTLTWASTNASSVQSSNFGASSVNGSLTLSNLTSTTSSSSTKQYTITVRGSGGTATATVNVTVLPPGPSVTLTASPLSIPYNGTSTLTWTSANATSASLVNLSNNSTVSTLLNGSTAVTLTTTTSFRITVLNSNGQSATANVTVTVGSQPPTVELCATNLNDLTLPSSKSCITEKTVGYNSQLRLEWTSTNATAVVSTSGSRFTGITTTAGSFTLPYNITTQATYSISVSGPGGTATDSIIIKPNTCTPDTFQDSFALYKFATLNFNNGTITSPPPYSSTSSLGFFVSTVTNLSLPGRPNYSYSLMHSFIYSAYRSILNRSPEKGGVEYYINLFVNRKSEFRILSELYKNIQDNAIVELNDRSAKGGLKSITDSCGSNWDTSSPLPAPTTCVSSNITDSSTNAIYRNGFITYGNGVDTIIEPYYISTINSSLALPDRSNFTYGQVHEYIRSKYSSTLSRVPEKTGFVYWVNDFQLKLSNGTFKYPDLASLGVAIDASASTELSTRTNNGGFIAVVDTCGNVIQPKPPTFTVPEPCVPETSSNTYANFKKGTILYNNQTTNAPLQFFVSTKSIAYSTNLPNKSGFTYGQVQDFIANYYTTVLGRPVEDGGLVGWTNVFNSTSSMTALDQLGDEISYDYNYVSKEGPIVDSKGGRKWITDTCGEITTVAGPCSPTTSSGTYANFKQGRVIYNDRSRSSYLAFFRSSKSNSYTVFLPNKPQFSYGQVQDFIANYYTTNLGRPVEESAISPTSASWVTIFNLNANLITLNDLGNLILNTYNSPENERDIVASKGGRRWIHDTCMRIWTP